MRSRLMREAEKLDEAERQQRLKEMDEEYDPTRYEVVDGLPRWVHSCVRGPVPSTQEVVEDAKAPASIWEIPE